MQAKKITEFINSIRDLTGGGVCYYDLETFFNYSLDGVKSNKGHYCEFCNRARSLKDGRELCNESDRVRAVALANEYKAPFFFECHMGMRELIVPLIHLGKLAGIIFVGQCRIENEDMTKTVLQSAQRLGGDPEEFKRLYFDLPTVNKNVLIAAGNTLSLYFEAMLQKNDILRINGEEEISQADLSERMRNYIDINYYRNITPTSVAERYFVNSSYASRIFSKNVGITMNEYINQRRIERAKLLLESTSIPIGSISINVGVLDANYFARLFKRMTGVTPKEYREKNKK